jgi:hypothetical protein
MVEVASSPGATEADWAKTWVLESLLTQLGEWEAVDFVRDNQPEKFARLRTAVDATPDVFRIVDGGPGCQLCGKPLHF